MSSISPDPTAAGAFPDGGLFRIEIPSVEGPAALEAVLDQARRYDLTIHRVSQGSGVAMLDDQEIGAMVAAGAAANVELCLFLGPRGTWDIGGSAKLPGSGLGPRVRGADQVRFSIDDAERAANLGVRCLLVADEGVLHELHRARVRGDLPADLRLKMSALTGPANPASFAVIERLGADSINVPGDLTVTQLAELRSAGRAAIDVYIESPDNLGGFVRHHEAPEIVLAAAPVYLKFGLRNAADIYPVGMHLESLAVSSARERVRRAHLTRELLDRHGLLARMSPRGAYRIEDLARFRYRELDASGAVAAS
ncbi:hypothetical protein GCM10022222_80670 [Amycolatopsis ultiminotia]|uniref:Uncharacterized protein n=1 Tax=Amycolatopsis ultiminotia TaxID=543629 RepID=A0ABP6YM14_9PSEU